MSAVLEDELYKAPSLFDKGDDEPIGKDPGPTEPIPGPVGPPNEQ